MELYNDISHIYRYVHISRLTGYVHYTVCENDIIIIISNLIFSEIVEACNSISNIHLIDTYKFITRSLNATANS